MTGPSGQTRSPVPAAVTLVWIDSREAILVRRVHGESRFTRIASSVPAHHRATGHVRHDPGVRHGGGGPPQTAGDPRRLERLARFLDAVACRVPGDEDLLLIGPGTVHERLARLVKERDLEHLVRRHVATERAARMTRRQLAARLGRAEGREARRRTVGAYRWAASPPPTADRRRMVVPRRVVEKHAHRPDDELPEG
jgi:hypothetical protein